MATNTNLEQGRANAVTPLPSLEGGDGVDEEALFCFLLEECEKQCIYEMSELLELFEEEFHMLTESFRDKLRMCFRGRPVSEAPTMDDLRREAMLETFVKMYGAKYYGGALEAIDHETQFQEVTPPSEESESRFERLKQLFR